jgi:predicted ATPase
VQTRRRETVQVQKGPARLQSVRLENIGPFKVLELDLHGHWNILLGDNGVGKSTILKAIAVGICGEDAQPYAHRLISSGEKSATVTLETTEGARYVTEIFQTDRGAEVRSRTVRPLDAEGWLALGFPPLRTFSWARPKGSEPQKPKRRATSDDLLPLITDELDPRMDGLKQWVWDLDYLSTKQDIEGRGDSRYRRLLTQFFEVVDQLTTEVPVQLNRVNPETREITIITDDGEVPIEALSQGAESLIGWTGILLRRLYEMYGDEENPREKYALVLMDELDAHMHPAWQQSLVHNLSRLFPGAQFIATTHSPLVVGGLPIEQVVRLARRDGRVVRLDVDEDMTLGRTDQVLTGSLFGLETTLDRQTQEKIVRYRDLLGTGKREDDEERQALRETLAVRIPAPQEGLAERRAQDFLQDLLLEQVGADYPEMQQRLLEKAEQLLAAVQSQREMKR